MVYETYSAEETKELGRELIKNAAPGDVYALVGELGVGKTVFAQGAAEGLGITEPVTSPTFTIVQIYDEGRMPLYHFDVCRITDIREMEDIGYEEYFDGNGITMIEWADLIEEILPSEPGKNTADSKAAEITKSDKIADTTISTKTKITKITIEKDLEKGFDYRRITVE